ncbi:MAG: UPF0175 family protein [Syntrophomonadaceae bacterium]|nr:UPF0175 family protein [Syntrophomonadaceae bacterium]
MNNSIFQLQLPSEFLPLLDKINGDSIDQKVRVAFASNLFAKKAVSLAKAAELAGETLADFIDILKEQGIPWGEYTEGHMQQDEQVIKKMLKEMDIKK